MSSIRTLKPEYWSSESLAQLPRDARSTFQGLWTEADCRGRGVANVKVLCGHIWPHDDDITPEVLEEYLQLLAGSDHIVLYSVSDKRYYAVLKWEVHQAESYRRGTPKHPGPPDEPLPVTRGIVPAPRGTEGKGREGKGIDRNVVRGTTPDEFPITDALKEWASKNGCDHIDLKAETEKFLDHHAAKGSRFQAWDRAWHKWMRNARDWGTGSPVKISGSTHVASGAPRANLSYGDPVKLPGEK